MYRGISLAVVNCVRVQCRLLHGYSRSKLPHACMSLVYSSLLNQHQIRSNKLPLTRHLVSQFWKPKEPELPPTPDRTDLKPYPRLKSLDGVKEKLGLYKFHRWVLQGGAIELYLSATDKVPLENFIKHCNLPDTMDSWFCVTSLHIWMIMCRCNLEGSTGIYCGRRVVSTMWKDHAERLSLLEIRGAKVKNEVNKEFGRIFLAILHGLDEGLTSDRVLAAALWRHFFSFQDVDPIILEMMVRYVRVQLNHLNQYDGDYIISRGEIVWKPFPPLIPES